MTATGSSEKNRTVPDQSHFGIRFAPYALMWHPSCYWPLAASPLSHLLTRSFSVLKAADLPPVQIGAVIMVGCYSLVGYLVPGATNTANIIASQNYGTTLYAGAYRYHLLCHRLGAEHHLCGVS